VIDSNISKYFTRTNGKLFTTHIYSNWSVVPDKQVRLTLVSGELANHQGNSHPHVLSLPKRGQNEQDFSLQHLVDGSNIYNN
jgi:hypothetical protein